MNYKNFILSIVALATLCSCSDSSDPTQPVVTPPVLPEPAVETLHQWVAENLIETIEAENGVLVNATISKAEAGYSGTGYLTGFWANTASVSITVEVPEKAMYRLKIDYICKGGNANTIVINDLENESTMSSFPISNTFKVLDMGKYMLNKGKNTIKFRGGWGDVFIDKFTIYTAPKNTYNIAPNLVDANANAQTKKVYTYLKDNFGKKMISGFLERKLVNGVSDRTPMLYGWDFASYTEGYPWRWENDKHVFGVVDNGTTEDAIGWDVASKKAGIVTFHWHWASPSGGTPGNNTFYTDKTNFKVTEAVKPGTAENILILRDIDAIAVQLKKLEAAGVSVLWRPLHEAGGGWFWWGAQGPEACVELYNIIFDRLTNHHNIHNLIWVWSSNEKEWYPGNDKVDIIGYDSYPEKYNVGVQPFMYNGLYELTAGKKIIALTENGAIPDPDACFVQDAPWSYFMAWHDLLYEANTAQHINNVFHNKNVVALDK